MHVQKKIFGIRSLCTDHFRWCYTTEKGAYFT